MLYCPSKTNPFDEKCCTVSKKPKTPIFLGLQGRLSKKIGFLGTVQHFRRSRGRKCCTVPKNQSRKRKVLYSPKKKTFFFLSLQGTPTKKIGFLGTVQHFLPLDLQKCCTVPKKPILLMKSAVLSLKYLKNQSFQVSKVDSPKRLVF